MAIPLAGNWDPTAWNELFSGGAQGFYGAPKDEYSELEKSLPKRPVVDPSKLGEVGQAIYATQPDPQTLFLQARLQDISARRASELSRQNIDYSVSQQSKYESERDKRRLQLGLLARIPELIGEAFAAPGKYALLGSQMGTQSLANVLNTPSASFQSVSPQYQKYLS